VRRAADRIAALDPAWIHAMHGGTLTREALPAYMSTLRRQEFAYRGKLLGRMMDEGACPAEPLEAERG
jgi:hypothetical protein